jgi:hypothetical protein
MCSSSISFSLSSSTNLPDKSIVLFDPSKKCHGLVFFSEPLTINAGLLIKILHVLSPGESHLRATTNSMNSTCSSSSLQLGLTNCDIQSLMTTNKLPLTIEAINQRSEFWIIQDFRLNNKATIDAGDEFLFVIHPDGVIEFSHNKSKFEEFIHVDSNLNYYPFLIFQDDIIALRSLGYLNSLDKCRSLRRVTSKETESATHAIDVDKTNESQVKLNHDCVVCFDRMRNTVLIPCGHICVCFSCAKELHEHGDKQCKSTIVSLIELDQDKATYERNDPCQYLARRTYVTDVSLLNHRLVI